MSAYNQANVTNFVIDIPDAGLTKAFKCNVTTALIPGIRTPIVEIPSGTQGLARSHLPGSTIEFDPLTVRFIVDENLDTWLELYRWMLSVNNYLTGDSSAHKSGNIPEFITLHVLDNTKTKIVLSVHYIGAFCSDIGELEFTYTEDGNPAITCTANFNYKYFLIEKDGVIISTKNSIAQQAIENGGATIQGLHQNYKQTSR